MEKLVIIGAGGFGRETAWLTERINRANPTWDLLGFIVDSPATQPTVIAGYPVLGDDSWLKSNGGDVCTVCAIGSGKTRKSVIEQLKEKLNEQFDHLRFATLIDPGAVFSNSITAGVGCIICAGSILTVDITLGAHVIVNLDCTIGHDAILNDYTTLYPGVHVSGRVHIGECAEIGTGTQIIQGITIGENTIVGAGSVVIKSLPSHCTAVGCPAVPLKVHDGSK